MTPMVTISYILKRQVELHLGSRRSRTRSRHLCTKRTLRRRRFKKRCAALELAMLLRQCCTLESCAGLKGLVMATPSLSSSHGAPHVENHLLGIDTVLMSWEQGSLKTTKRLPRTLQRPVKITGLLVAVANVVQRQT